MATLHSLNTPTQYPTITLVDGTGNVYTPATTTDLATVTARQLFVRKTADETVTSSITKQNDDHLFLALEASSTYTFQAVIFYDGATTGDIRTGFTVPAGATLLWGQIGIANSATSTIGSFQLFAGDSTGTANNGSLGAATKVPLFIRGLVVTGVTAGNLQFQWAQLSSDATAVTVFANSWLEATKR